MKKYITILGFFTLFLFGSQIASGQEGRSTISVEAAAKKKTHELHELVELTGTQQGDVFKLLLDAEQNLEAINQQGGDEASVQKRRREFLNHVDKKLSVILTPEQFRIYKQSLEQQNANKVGTAASVSKKKG